MILGRFLNCSQVGVSDSVIRMFVRSAGPEIWEDDVLYSAHFGQVQIPLGAGTLGNPSGRCADLERPQDQMV